MVFPQWRKASHVTHTQRLAHFTPDWMAAQAVRLRSDGAWPGLGDFFLCPESRAALTWPSLRQPSVLITSPPPVIRSEVGVSYKV